MGSGGGEREGSQAHSEPGGVVEGGGRASKHTQSQEEWWRGPGGQPNTLRAGRSDGGGREGSQTHSEQRGVLNGARRAAKHTQRRQAHSESGGVVEGSRRTAKNTQSWGEWLRGAGGQPSTLRAVGSGGGEREGIQAHSEPGGVVEGARRAAKRTQSREEWWRVTSL